MTTMEAALLRKEAGYLSIEEQHGWPAGREIELPSDASQLKPIFVPRQGCAECRVILWTHKKKKKERKKK